MIGGAMLRRVGIGVSVAIALGAPARGQAGGPALACLPSVPSAVPGETVGVNVWATGTDGAPITRLRVIWDSEIGQIDRSAASSAPAVMNARRSPKTPSPLRISPTPVSQADSTTRRVPVRSRLAASSAVSTPSSSPESRRFAPARARPDRSIGFSTTGAPSAVVSLSWRKNPCVAICSIRGRRVRFTAVSVASSPVSTTAPFSTWARSGLLCGSWKRLEAYRRRSRANARLRAPLVWVWRLTGVPRARGFRMLQRNLRFLAAFGAVVMLTFLVWSVAAPSAQSAAQSSALYYPPAGNWAHKMPAEVGMDDAKLADAIASMRSPR